MHVLTINVLSNKCNLIHHLWHINSNMFGTEVPSLGSHYNKGSVPPYKNDYNLKMPKYKPKLACWLYTFVIMIVLFFLKYLVKALVLVAVKQIYLLHSRCEFFCFLIRFKYYKPQVRVLWIHVKCMRKVDAVMISNTSWRWHTNQKEKLCCCKKV
jgi:hypothetical protein